MNRMRAFTLVEILVVIAIICILTVIVIASTLASKNRGNDSALKTDLSTIETQATLYYGIGNTYGASNSGANATCGQSQNGNTVFYDTTTNLDTPIQEAITAATNDASGGNLGCQSQSSWFVVYGKISDGNYWCIDSSNPLQSGVEIPVAPSGNPAYCSTGGGTGN